MWYFAWILGTLFACCIAIIAAIAIEHAESNDSAAVDGE